MFVIKPFLKYCINSIIDCEDMKMQGLSIIQAD